MYDRDSYATRAVKGEIHFVCGQHAFVGGILSIRLLDVSRADAAAVIIGEQILTGIRCQAGSTVARTFAMLDLTIQPRAHYTISAHCDVDADGSVSIGDYISVQSYPVLTFGHSDYVVVWLQPVQ